MDVLSRRRLLVAVAAALVGSGASRCGTGTEQGARSTPDATAPEEGRIGARPRRAAGRRDRGGLRPLGLGGARDGLLYVPADVRGRGPLPLVVMLHGAGGSAENGLAPFRPLADERGLALLAPESRGPTWDLVRGRYGPDVAFVDRALAHAFAAQPVDPARVAVAGFSDGASYALSLGLTNGDLFRVVIAFSPGFAAPLRRHGRPRVFVSHGRADRVLPIDRCSRRIVPELRGLGYDVRYREFAGGHTVPPRIAREAARLLG